MADPPSTSPTLPESSIADLLAQYPVSSSQCCKLRELFHKAPELSTLEINTAAQVVTCLSRIGVFEIHKDIGGYGIAAVLKNGPGKTILLRSELDALPIREQTDLPYASKVVQTDFDGKAKPVMHACGHDVHIVCLLATGGRLVRMKDSWSGTVILLFQPDKERSGGAQKMVNAGLFIRVPIPDVLLAQHVGPQRAGRIGINPGPALFANDSLRVTLYGKGAHGSAPAAAIDPIIMMASCILRLQTIISRELDIATEFAILTIGQCSAGDAPNVIPETATFQLNVRTADETVRMKVLKSIRRIVKAETEASGAPSLPTFEVLSSFPLTVNDPQITQVLSQTFSQVFGDEFRPKEFPGIIGSDDLPTLAKAINKPYCMWAFGGSDPSLYDEKGITGVPGNHSPFFSPVMQPTLKTGIDAMTAATLTFLM